MALYRIFKKDKPYDTVAYLDAENKQEVVRDIVENGYRPRDYEIELINEED